MIKKFISLFLAFCLLCGCTKTEETPAETPQEQMETEQIVEEAKAKGLAIPTVTRDSQITDEDVRQLLIFLGVQELDDGSLCTFPGNNPLFGDWSNDKMTAVCYDWYQMKMTRQYTTEELNEKYTGPYGRQYNYDWYYPAEEFIPEAEKYFDLDAVNLKSNDFYYHEETDCFVCLGDMAGFGDQYTIERWERFEDKLSIYLSSFTTTGLPDEKICQSVLTVRLENKGFRYMSHRILAPEADKSTIYRILAVLTQNKDSSLLEIKDWKQHDRLLTIDLYDKVLEQDMRLTALYHEKYWEWDWRCISYDEAESARRYTTQLTVHESYEGDALSAEKMNFQFTLPDGFSLKETFSADGQVAGLFLYYGGEQLGRISIYHDAGAEFFNSKAEPWAYTSDFADLSEEMNRGCYRHITEYPAKEFQPFERGIAYYLNLDGYCMDVWVMLDRSKPEQQQAVEELLSSLRVSEVKPQKALTKTVQLTADNYTDFDFEPVIEMLVPEKSTVTDERVYFDDVEGPYAFRYSALDNGQYLSITDSDFSADWTRGFCWIEINGQNAFVEKREAMLDRNGPELPLYLYCYNLCLDDNGDYLHFAIVSRTADMGLAIAEQREFVENLRLIKQAGEAPIPEEALTEQEQKLLHITQSLDIMGLTVDESMSEEQKGLFILWLLGTEEHIDKWEVGLETYKIPLTEIEWMLQDRTMLESIDPVAAFGSKYSEKDNCLYLDMLGGYGGARAHGLVSIEENENRTKIVLGSYDMDTFWAEPPIYTLQEIITAEFEFQWGEWRIVDMSREKIG